MHYEYVWKLTITPAEGGWNSHVINVVAPGVTPALDQVPAVLREHGPNWPPEARPMVTNVERSTPVLVP